MLRPGQEVSFGDELAESSMAHSVVMNTFGLLPNSRQAYRDVRKAVALEDIESRRSYEVGKNALVSVLLDHEKGILEPPLREDFVTPLREVVELQDQHWATGWSDTHKAAENMLNAIYDHAFRNDNAGERG